MMETRNKYWRKRKGFFRFKKRMVLLATNEFMGMTIDGRFVEHPHWFQLARYGGFNCYRTTGTPCSCWLCRGEAYSRLEFKKETRRILRESEE